MNITEKEMNILKGITRSDFYEDGRESLIWTWSIESNLSGGTRNGVIRSLVKKGLIESGEKTTNITPKGYAALDERNLIDENGNFF